MTESEGCPKPYSCSCNRVTKSCFSRPQRRAESSSCQQTERERWDPEEVPLELRQPEPEPAVEAVSKPLGNVGLLPSQETSGAAGVGGEGPSDSQRPKWAFSEYQQGTEP